MTDNRFPSPGSDTRFETPGVDARFPSPGSDTRFPNPGEDARFQNLISITATVEPVAEEMVPGQAANTIANYATITSTANYAIDGDTIASAVVQFDGVTIGAGTDTTSDLDVVTVLVTATGGATRTWTIDSQVTYPAPVAAGGLADQTFANDSGIQTYDVSFDFTGDDLTYALTTAPTGVTIDGGTGVVSFDTDALNVQSLTAIVASASNSGGSVTSGFSMTILDFSVSIVDDGIDITGGSSPYTVTVTTPTEYAGGSPYVVNTSGIGSGPVLVVQPDITGTLETGNALTAPDPLYFFTGTDSLAYQWQRDTGGGFADISGATGATLTDVQNDTAGDVRRKTTVTDDNGSLDVFTNEPEVTSGAPVDIVATLFGSSEDGFYYDTRDNTDLYIDESLTGGNPSDGAQFGGLVDSSGNGKTGEQDVVSRRPRWREAAKAFETDGVTHRIDGANAGGNSFASNMTFMCAFKLLNGNDSVVFGTGGTSGIGFVRINDAELIFSTCGTPTLYLDGVAQDTATAAIKATLQDGSFHLIEIRNLDLTDSRWDDGLSFGIRGDNSSTPTNMQMGSPVLTSNVTPASITAARQYYVQNHGVTLT